MGNCWTATLVYFGRFATTRWSNLNVDTSSCLDTFGSARKPASPSNPLFWSLRSKPLKWFSLWVLFRALHHATQRVVGFVAFYPYILAASLQTA
jgi:hypothetical protein